MSRPAPLVDVLPDVLSRYEELSSSPLARRLGEVRIGPTSLWDAIRYDVADAIYDETYREMSASAVPDSSLVARARTERAFGAVRDTLTRNLWQAQLGDEVLVGLLSARLGLVGDLLETGFFYAERWRSRQGRASRADVLVAGSMYRVAVAALGPALERLRSQHGLESLVVAHDDVLRRHERTFDGLRMRWRAAAAFSSRAHRAAANHVADRARAVLAEAQAADGRVVPETVRRKTLSARTVRRLAWNFLAAESAMSACDPSLVVIPDERQPLARLVGLEAAKRGIAVVSAPLPRDQIYRKTPLWDPVATRVLVFSPLAARFLGRAGAPPRLFECASGLRVEANGSRSRPDVRSELRRMLGLDARTRIVLFASQAQSSNSILLPMVAACTAAIPDATLVIRPHPYESPSLVRLMNPRTHVSTALGARQAIQAADVLVTHSSFMAVEAALLDCPVVLVSPDPVPTLIPLIEEGLARWACTETALRRTLEDLLDGRESRLRAAQERFRKEQEEVPGPERTAELIADLVLRSGTSGNDRATRTHVSS